MSFRHNGGFCNTIIRNRMTFCKCGVAALPPRTSCKQSAARPASLEALAGRPIVHNSTRFGSMPRVANIPRYALHVHNASRRNQALSDPHLCPKPLKNTVRSNDPMIQKKRGHQQVANRVLQEGSAHSRFSFSSASSFTESMIRNSAGASVRKSLSPNCCRTHECAFL